MNFFFASYHSNRTSTELVEFSPIRLSTGKRKQLFVLFMRGIVKLTSLSQEIIESLTGEWPFLHVPSEHSY